MRYKINIDYTAEEINLAAKLGFEAFKNKALEHDQIITDVWETLSETDQGFYCAFARSVLKNKIGCRHQHNRWWTHMKHEGWVRGEYNPELKHHPLLIDFNQLPEVEKEKRRAFRAAVMPYRKHLGPGVHFQFHNETGRALNVRTFTQDVKSFIIELCLHSEFDDNEDAKSYLEQRINCYIDELMAEYKQAYHQYRFGNNFYGVVLEFNAEGSLDWDYSPPLIDFLLCIAKVRHEDPDLIYE